ncbi:hypothetical protein BBR47_30110 [Brevibacillus brevis NBRC 100599]|uniref:Uncharacterized protein n=1 Tax=Brevibacillus brevis (strain 47 / JCM 6285 / NBRC 100599) TaxID=358681 RepID=C0ZDX9_BREBN|nr:hypothetical protein BBR47_30110 [Brevibacillus brevis NBRC 100599]
MDETVGETIDLVHADTKKLLSPCVMIFELHLRREAITGFPDYKTL